MGKIEKMFIIKHLSACPKSIKKLVKGLIEEIAKLQAKNFRLLAEREKSKEKLSALRKELLKQCHLNIKLRKQLLKSQKELSYN
jgi:peptidoglycan hydrolase CwlO-like protein